MYQSGSRKETPNHMRYFKQRDFVEGKYTNVGRLPGQTWDTNVAGIVGSTYYTWGQGNARGVGFWRRGL